MAELYARIVVSLPWHDKVVGIPERDRAAAFGVYCAAVCFCQSNLTDGAIRHADFSRVFPLKNIERIAGILVSAGLLDNDVNVYRVHDYLVYNKSKQQVEDKIAGKKSAGQRGGEASAKARAQAPAQAPAQAESNPDTDTDTDTKNKYTDYFEKFWSAYPERKGGKHDASLKYAKRLEQGATDASLLLAAVNYAKDRAADNDRPNADRFTKHASAFLYQRNDEDYQTAPVAADDDLDYIMRKWK
jgi:hypothetical protein